MSLIRTPIQERDCAACPQKIKSRQFLICSKCKLTYDLQCANVSLTRFMGTLIGEHRANWKCAMCYEKPKGDNTNTPVGRHADENVTQRKRNTRKLSLDNLSVETLDCSDIATSCSPNNSSKYISDDLKDSQISNQKLEIEELIKQLIQARGEIQILQTENTQLRCTIHKLDKKNSQQPKKPRLSDTTNQTQNKVDNTINILLEKSEKNQNTAEKNNIQSKQTKSCDNAKPKIVIIGDQMCKDMASKLIAERSSEKNAKEYTIVNHCYPDTPTDIMLLNINIKNLDLSEDDWVILSTGSNDKNPTKFFIELSSVLKKLTKSRVLVSEVLFNPYLNEERLNHEIKKVTKNLHNCEYLPVSSRNKYNKYSKQSVAKLHKVINTYINTQDYKDCYIGKNILKMNKTQMKTHTSNTKPGSLQLNVDSRNPKRGTIPFYFNIKTISTSNSNSSDIGKIAEISNDNSPNIAKVPFCLGNATKSNNSPKREEAIPAKLFRI